MGSSGAGKSTLSSLFGEFKLEAKVDKKIGIIIDYIYDRDLINKNPPKIA